MGFRPLIVKKSISNLISMNRFALLRNLLLFFTFLIVFMFSLSLIIDDKRGDVGYQNAVEASNTQHLKAPKGFEHNH